MRRLLVFVVGAMVACGLMASPAAASKTHQAVTASITLNPGDPSIGQAVSFTSTYPGSVKNPRIEINCYQNGVLVWGELGDVTTSFVLGSDSSPWLNNGGGPANCEADLLSQVWNGNGPEQLTTLASTFFDATA